MPIYVVIGAVLLGGPNLADAVDYLRDIKPVLKERCYACHGSLKQKADLRVDTAVNLLKAEVVVVGNAGTSELLTRLRSADDEERMPPEGHALTAAQISAIEQWIDSGAPVPVDEVGEDDPRSHWSFQPVKRPQVPDVPGVTHPVDAFLATKQNANALVRQQAAPRPILIRRVYLDLIGLPPTAEQLTDQRPWQEIVDELLASPQHGERWGRHWMDVWRYSDWYGLGAQLRYSQKHLWHWRDWIVDSLNEDKGYDRMISEMLAGDELAPQDPDIVRATGFLARNYFLFNRTSWLDNTIEHTGKAFLGLTINCAKCHDHKYDPISFEDYYRFRAVFEPHQVRLDPVAGETDLEKDGLPRVFDDQLDARTYLHLRGDPANEDKETEITPGVPAFLAQFANPIEAVKLPAPAYAPGAQEFVQRDHLAQAANKVETVRKALEKARAALASTADPKAESTGSGPPAEPAEPFLLEDDFSSAKPALWELRGSGLAYQNGALEQTVATREPAKLVSRAPLPRDFEMTCRYTTIGGPTFKSVTFRFDFTDDDKHANFVYTSEHAPGPKVQAAFTRAGKTSYPGDGRAKKADSTGQTQELRVAVRDRLANVWLDGKFVFAYEFPNRIDGGRFALSAFDATARFEKIRIASLAADAPLTASKNASAIAPRDSQEQLSNELKVAEKDLASAVAAEASLQATVAADTARFTGSADADLKKSALGMQIKAQQALAAADVERYAGGDAKKLKEAEKSQKTADEKWAAFEKGEGTYQPLRASKKALETPAHKDTDYPASYPETSSGRRSMLARWIVDAENPLTARVAVNHVWMRHFGEPLVETVFDFGRQAPRPLHAELLDYLAAELVESGWSFKHLHRLLLNSQTYQLNSSNAGADAATLAGDPVNRFYWRMNPQRMQSQVVRDSLLQLSGELDLTMGGPSLDSQKAGNRRSLYFTHSPDKLDPFLTMFDDADLLACYRRSESVVPQQALALSNSALSLQSAKLIAEKIGYGPEREPSDFVERAFSEILARPPLAEETTECLRFLDELETLAADGKQPDDEGRARAYAQLVHALLNHNDFVTIR